MALNSILKARDKVMTSYKINEIFYSLQGEGRWAGRAALFVRFSKCNLACPFCDTDFVTYRELSGADIVAALGRYPLCRFVVLTGGEPTLQVDPELLRRLHERGYYVAMETNGTNPIPEGVDWVTCSPKAAFVKGGLPRVGAVDELKVVFDGRHEVSDFGIEAAVRYVQPCDTGDARRNKAILAEAVAFVKDHPEWQLSLQQHKLIGIR